MLEVPSIPESTPAFVSISDIAEEEIQKLEKKYKEGNHVRVRILGLRHLEGLATGVLKASALEEAVFTHSDVKPGMVLKAKILSVDSFGAIVQIPGGVKALCPLRHMSELEIAKPEKKNSRCTDGAEHTYCMREMLEKLPEGVGSVKNAKTQWKLKTRGRMPKEKICKNLLPCHKFLAKDFLTTLKWFLQQQKGKLLNQAKNTRSSLQYRCVQSPVTKTLSVYPNNMTFDSPEEQEKYIRQWLEDRLGFAYGFSIKFYPGKFSRDKRSILAVGDISEIIPDEDADIAVL
ncbi:rRNA biogenesis protein rrp5 [Lathyrus oleraceus]|uniref:rRNA biogenesis protein rrp5 n=1 Tax=Pisum sativum TaxID=3888 RepID=A0A9D4W7S6_PEA|nr:rRNA biogenesis protein rrp5 [Pisum sativum]